MNELLARVRDFYVEPGEAPAAPRRRAAAPPPGVAVLGPAREAGVAACALALGLARSGGWPAALAAFWRCPGGRGWRLPAVPAARRLASRLDGHGMEADASGRLARAWLADEAGVAAAAAQRASGAARLPVALALAGPRQPEVDDLLRVQDVVVLVARRDEDPALAELARESLAALPPPALACDVPAGAMARALALSGAVAAGGLRGAVRAALEAAA